MVDHVLRPLNRVATMRTRLLRPGLALVAPAIIGLLPVASLAAEASIVLDPATGIIHKSAPLGGSVPEPKAVDAAAALHGLKIDAGREAVFASPASGPTAGAGPLLRARSAAGSPSVGSGTSEAVSPVYVDAAGNPRALPGGVIVTFKDEVDDDTARQRIAASGQQVERRLGPGLWLITTASGEAALEATRALEDSGQFRSVEPNWWRPPVHK